MAQAKPFSLGSKSGPTSPANKPKSPGRILQVNFLQPCRKDTLIPACQVNEILADTRERVSYLGKDLRSKSPA